MLDYSLYIFQEFVQVLKVFIPLYLVFDLVGDMLFRRT